MPTKSELVLRHAQEHLSSLTDGVVRDVERSEIEREFPFDRLNDVRAYLNFAAHYVKSFVEGLGRCRSQGVTQESLAQALGTSTRFRRYFLLSTIGAYLGEGLPENSRLEFLLELTALAYGRSPRSALPTSAPTARLDLPERSGDIGWEPGAAATLCVKLRQFVDLVFLGEHPLGYQAFLTTMGRGKPALVRHFWRLDEGGFLVRPENVSVIYLLDKDKRLPRVNPFTGEAAPIPSREDALPAFVFVDGLPARADAGGRLRETVDTAIARCSETQTDCSAAELEVEKMKLFSTEVAAVSLLAGRKYVLPTEAREAITTSRRANALKAELRADTFAEAYFTILKRSIGWLIASLGGGE
jgi:hypothetical protein